MMYNIDDVVITSDSNEIGRLWKIASDIDIKVIHNQYKMAYWCENFFEPNVYRWIDIKDMIGKSYLYWYITDKGKVDMEYYGRYPDVDKYRICSNNFFDSYENANTAKHLILKKIS